MSVTPEELIALCSIAQERGPWTITEEGRIRNVKSECPLCALANVAGEFNAWKAAAWTAAYDCLGADPSDANDEAAVWAVVHAADNPTNLRRAELLFALGMSE